MSEARVSVGARAAAGMLAAPAVQRWSPGAPGSAEGARGLPEVAWVLRGGSPLAMAAWAYVWARDDGARGALFAALLLVAERWAAAEGWRALPDPARGGRPSLRLRALVDLTLEELRLGPDALGQRLEVERYTRVGIAERSWRRTWRARHARLLDVASGWALQGWGEVGAEAAVPGRGWSEG